MQFGNSTGPGMKLWWRPHWVLLLLAALLSSCTYRFYEADCRKAMPGNLVLHATLDSTLAENSGLVYLDGSMWTFNDSGGEPALYRFDPSSGSIIRKTVVKNAWNVDWEDITMDEQYMYVADVGNNFASRDTVAIYRISVDSLLLGNEVVEQDGVITLSFDEKVETNSDGWSTHDCEALFAYHDSLYLFTKNWVDASTSVYVIPSRPGHYQLKHRYHYQARLLVTGADINPLTREVSLVGYRNYMPVVITYGYEEDPAEISCGGRGRIYPLKLGRQVEGICYGRGGRLYISSELSLKDQTLFKLGGTGR